MIAPTQGLALLLLALIVLGFGGFFWRASLLYRLLRLGRNEDRNDRPLRRLRDEIVIYLGQRKLLKRPYYIRGIGHALEHDVVEADLRDDEACYRGANRRFLGHICLAGAGASPLDRGAGNSGIPLGSRTLLGQPPARIGASGVSS